MQKTKRILVTITEQKHKTLALMAREKGISIPTLCRLVLSDLTERKTAA